MMTDVRKLYRRDIDGLRALAVISVIIFHANHILIPGGYLGVDVFFVISGFLITRLLVNEMQAESFSIINFYERRARRILPALFFMLVLCLPLAWQFLLPHQLKDFGQALGSIALFVSNYFFYLEIDYFNNFADKSPLLHTWSLAVEEQFYIIFPLICLACFKIDSLNLKWVVLSILIVSFALAVSTSISDPDLSFYSLHTRAWELLVGSMVALLPERAKKSRINWTDEFIVALSLLGLMASFVVINDEFNTPSFSTSLPVLSAGLIIYFGQYSALARSVLGNRIVVHFGLLSYSLYLIHIPVFSFYSLRFDNNHTFFELSWLLMVIYMFSYFSWRFIERPFRDPTYISRKYIFILSVSGLICIFILGTITHISNGFMNIKTRNFVASGLDLIDRDLEREKRNRWRDVAFKNHGSPHFDSSEVFDSTKPKRVLILGDSMADDFVMAAYKDDRNLQGTSIRKLYVDDLCMKEFTYFISSRFDNPEGCSFDIDHKALLAEATDIVLTADWAKNSMDDAISLAQYLSLSSNKRLYFVSSVKFDDISMVLMDLFRKGYDTNGQGDRSDVIELGFSYIDWDVVELNSNLRISIEAISNVNWVDKTELFCNMPERKCDLIRSDTGAMIFDNAHLTEAGLVIYGDFIYTNIITN